MLAFASACVAMLAFVSACVAVLAFALACVIGADVTIAIALGLELESPLSSSLEETGAEWRVVYTTPQELCERSPAEEGERDWGKDVLAVRGASVTAGVTLLAVIAGAVVLVTA